MNGKYEDEYRNGDPAQPSRELGFPMEVDGLCPVRRPSGVDHRHRRTHPEQGTLFGTTLVALAFVSNHPFALASFEPPLIPGFTDRGQIQEAAWNHGFRKANGEAEGWLYFRSDESVPGEIALSAGMGEGPLEAGALWFLAVEHAGVSAQMRAEYAYALVEPPPGRLRACFVFADHTAMRAAVSRAFHLARSLPSYPLAQFEDEVAGLGDTEVAAIVKQRIGQGYFRRALLDYWNGRCPLTGVSTPAMLRASHIVPWAECKSDAERFDVHNGLLLAAHWDAAFDAGLVSFSNDAAVLAQPNLDRTTVVVLAPNAAPVLKLTDQHREKLAWHRAHFGFG